MEGVLKKGPGEGARSQIRLDPDSDYELNKRARVDMAAEKDDSNAKEVAGSRKEIFLSHHQKTHRQHDNHHQLLPPPPENVVRWERFLPFGSLKVLLVENDDSTRHVVSALLRNCSYEVIAVADGLQAWKFLEDLKNRVDIVLTEVVMPFFSGIGLLCKLMGHKTCKNIPVIMMSSNDSMGIVFKCLSKGAVDFLVKPVRKNELKNLWQHVWRRCHSSSGSGSESGIRIQKSVRSKSADNSDNSTESDNEDDFESSDLNARDGSDNGSGTQISWTKHAMEIGGSQKMSPHNRSPDLHDSTCKEDGLLRQDGREIIGTSVNRGPKGIHTNDMKNEDSGLENEGSNASEEPHLQEENLIIGIVNKNDPRASDESSKAVALCNGTTIGEDITELPSLALSLKRSRSAENINPISPSYHNKLKHSDFSAFSRYNSSSSVQAPTVIVGSCPNPLDSSEAGRAEYKLSTISNIFVRIQGSNNGNSSNDSNNAAVVGHTTLKNEVARYDMASASTVDYGLSGAPHPLLRCSPALPPALAGRVDDTNADPTKSVEHRVQVQHHHHHYHHHHHHPHGMQQLMLLQQPSDLDDASGENVAENASQCGSSNVFSIAAAPERNALKYYSVNGSASGSNNGSNGQQNRESTAVDVVILDKDIGAVDAGKCCEVVGTSGGSDRNRILQREAALNKFRQKRKERNFGKKVRYQSRKRLAEQRPRLRGQFVRRTTDQERPNKEMES